MQSHCTKSFRLWLHSQTQLGGTLVIGIQDKTKNVIGVENILQDKERIASAVADSVSPTLLSNLQFISWKDKDVLIVTVPHSLGPFYLKD